MIDIKTTRKSPIIFISVNGPEPEFTQKLARAIIDQLDELQREFKIEKVKEKRLFISNRIDEISSDLVQAENALKIFREKLQNEN